MADLADDDVLLLVGHGSTTGTAARDTLLQHAETLRGRRTCADVRVGLLRGEPALESVLAELAGRPVTVLPVFMSDGYLARNELPRRLAAAQPSAAQVTMLPPIGTSPALTRLLHRLALAAASAHGLDAAACVCVLVAHGNVDDARSREAAERHRLAIAGSRRFAGVRTAFIEEPPGVGDVVAATSAPVVLLGLFAAEGRHAGGDVPAVLAQIPNRVLVWCGAVGADPTFADALADHVAAA